MELTGAQIGQVLSAFAAAFDRGDLGRMLRVRLDRRLEELAGDGDLEAVLLDVIAAAQREGWTEDLISAAAGWLPGNEGLSQLARSLLSGGQPASPRQSAGETGLPVPHIDPDIPPYGLLRRSLAAAFDAPGLHRFCQVREPFRPLLDEFAPGHGVSDMIDRLLEFADKRFLWDELLAGLAEENPYQFHRLLERLRVAPPPASGVRRP